MLTRIYGKALKSKFFDSVSQQLLPGLVCPWSGIKPPVVPDLSESSGGEVAKTKLNLLSPTLGMQE